MQVHIEKIERGVKHMADYSIQLYSVRDCMKKDFEGTLKNLSEMGYTSVELAGFLGTYGHSAEEFKEIFKKNGLKISGSHSDLKDLINNYDETIAFHKKIGNKNYIIPVADLSSQEKIDSFVKAVNGLTPKLASDGITLSYHNHSEEFSVNSDGSNPYEQLIYRTDIMLEVDTFWAFMGMKNPAGLIDRIADRISFVHLKDGSPQGEGKPLGMGFTPLKSIFEVVIKHKIPIVVESETITPNGLAEAKICIDFMRSLYN